LIIQQSALFERFSEFGDVCVQSTIFLKLKHLQQSERIACSTQSIGRELFEAVEIVTRLFGGDR